MMLKQAIAAMLVPLSMVVIAEESDTLVYLAAAGHTQWHNDQSSAVTELQELLFAQYEQHCDDMGMIADLSSIEPVTPIRIQTRSHQQIEQFQLHLPSSSGLCMITDP